MKRRYDDSAFVIVFLAISAIALILIVGLALDSASWYLQASRVQRAADVAAMAGSLKLPDTAASRDIALQSLATNDIADGPDYSVKIDPLGDTTYVSVMKKKARTTFLSSVIPWTSIERKSAARRSSAQPILGSPYNFLGTGPLNIAGIPNQNFWLAINGPCSPAEDGDIFTAAWDKNKGAFDTSSSADAQHPYEYDTNPKTIKTYCKYGPQSASNPPIQGAIHNTFYRDNWGGTKGDPSYSYYIDIPPPPSSAGGAGTVTIKLYDPSFATGGLTGFANFNDDRELQQGGDSASAFDTYFTLFDTKGDDDPINDERLATQGFYGHDSRENATAKGTSLSDWQTLSVVGGDRIKNGATLRVQVSIPALDSSWDDIDHSTNTFARRGSNIFAIGAVASWLPANQPGCDSRNPSVGAQCPRVYGKGAMSVDVTLPENTSTTLPLYFAELDPATAGTQVNMYLWDPGESVKSIAVAGPGNTPITFDYKTADGAFAESNVDSIDTSGAGGEISSYLTNRYRFNDRLLIISFTVPTNYRELVDANNGDKWVKLQYTVVGNARNDRTTWGISFGASKFSPPHLIEN